MAAVPAPRFTTRERIAKLMSFDTTSRNSNLELIAFVEDYLSGHGVASRRIANEDGTKANLFATLGPADRAGGIVLSGHTAVVPVDGQDWTSRSEEHTSELQSLMRISYAVFCLNKKNQTLTQAKPY